jgi:hypothetical protein
VVEGAVGRLPGGSGADGAWAEAGPGAVGDGGVEWGAEDGDVKGKGRRGEALLVGEAGQTQSQYCFMIGWVMWVGGGGDDGTGLLCKGRDASESPVTTPFGLQLFKRTAAFRWLLNLWVVVERGAGDA